jgi:hypothetical protein
MAPVRRRTAMKRLTSTLTCALLLGAGLAQAASPTNADCIEQNELVLGSPEGNSWEPGYVGPEVPQTGGYVFYDDLARSWGPTATEDEPEVASGSSEIVLSEFVLGNMEGNSWEPEYQPDGDERPAIAGRASKLDCGA